MFYLTTKKNHVCTLVTSSTLFFVYPAFPNLLNRVLLFFQLHIVEWVSHIAFSHDVQSVTTSFLYFNCWIYFKKCRHVTRQQITVNSFTLRQPRFLFYLCFIFSSFIILISSIRHETWFSVFSRSSTLLRCCLSAIDGVGES